MWLLVISGWTLTSLTLALPVARALRFHPAQAVGMTGAELTPA
ncbi:hypothetical protein [Phenylobacterium soli]|nr:hypothetical protein [Phenylobacterium soli]